MGKFDGILICTDLDGTLYKNDKTISLENRAAIDYFKREGGFFTFITGRMPYYSIDAYNSVMPNVPFGCINGAGVYDGAENKYIWTREISTDVFKLVQHIDGQFDNIGIQVCCFDTTYFSRDNEMTRRFRRITNLPDVILDYREVNEPVGKIIFSSDDENVIFAIDKTLHSHPLAEKFDFIRSEKTLFEILPKNVNKGLALESSSGI